MKLKPILLTGLLLISSAVFAADKEVEDLLSKMRDAYKAVKAVKLTVKTTAPNDKGEQKTATTDVSFVAPDKFLVKLHDIPDADGRTITFVRNGDQASVNDGDKTEKTKYEENSPLPFVNLETICFWDYKKQLSTDEKANMHDSKLSISSGVKWQDKEWTVLEEHATQGEGDEKVEEKIKYFVDPKTNLIWRTVLQLGDDEKNTIDFQVSDMNTDAKIDESIFKID